MRGKRTGVQRSLLRFGSGQVYRLLKVALAHEGTRRWVIHYLSNQVAMGDADFENSTPCDVAEIKGFEDCYWLFSSNMLNHGLVRLQLDEAAYLYRLVHSLGAPRVVELGRYKGGMTFLLAAAGAQVLSLDDDSLPGQHDFLTSLEQALEHFHLSGHVKAVVGDALTYPVAAESADLVVVDFAKTYAMAQAGFEHWWPAVVPGGFLLFRDGTDSPLGEVVRFVSELDTTRCGAERLPKGHGSFAVLGKAQKTH